MFAQLLQRSSRSPGQILPLQLIATLAIPTLTANLNQKTIKKKASKLFARPVITQRPVAAGVALLSA
jgi:hypothetical protein